MAFTPNRLVVPTSVGFVSAFPMPTLSVGGPKPMRRRDHPVERHAVTTAFVGNISDKVGNDLIKNMLLRCGNVVNWKRIQGSNGKFQAFGYCEFDHPESTMRALRIMHNFDLMEKKLVVKVDEKTKKLIREYVNKKRTQQGKSPISPGADLPKPDESQRRLDEEDEKEQLKNAAALAAARPPRARGAGYDDDPPSGPPSRTPSPVLRPPDNRNNWESDEGEVPPMVVPDGGGGGGGKPGPAPVSSPQQQLQPPSASDVGRRAVTNSYHREHRDRPRSPSRQHSGRMMDRGRRYPSPFAPPPGTTDRRSRSRSRSATNRNSSRARSTHSGSENDDAEEKERVRLEKKLREKEANYQERLRKWESRERKKAKEYDKEQDRKRQKQKDDLKEAKKLKEFLEDYDDERDDLKFYRGAALAMRRKDYEKEKEHDQKDRQRERDELEEIRQRLVKDGVGNPDEELARIQREQEVLVQQKLGMPGVEAMRAALAQPSAAAAARTSAAAAAAAQRSPDDVIGGDDHDDDDEDGGVVRGGPRDDEPPEQSSDEEPPMKKPTPQQPETAKPTFTSTTSCDATQPIGFAGIKLGGQTASSSSTAKQVFGDDDETAGGSHRRKLVPIEYTAEERDAVAAAAAGAGAAAAPMEPPQSADEKKRLIKSLIERIPTDRDDLFAYEIKWDYVDESLIQRRLRPWVNKKFIEYIGDDESSLADLVDFICEKVKLRTPPDAILTDVSMVLDDEAEVFVVKMWRLLIYEIEAKKYGLVRSSAG